MSFSLALPEALRHQGWRVKIRDKERVEEPHVTVIRGASLWRFGIRSGQFLDAQPNPRNVPREVVDAIQAAMDRLQAEWDDAYPENPVQSDPNERKARNDDDE